MYLIQNYHYDKLLKRDILFNKFNKELFNNCSPSEQTRIKLRKKRKKK